jgi:fermentation-respiration switch protein FrsA (DUF1100 family)
MPYFLALLSLVLADVAAAAVVALAANRIVFRPRRLPSAEDGLGAFQDVDAHLVAVARPDGRRLAAYDVAPRDLSADAPVVLFLHGNDGNIALRAAYAERFARTAHVRLLLLDYSGYGGNAGSPSEAEIRVDALAAYDHLVTGGVDPARIVVFGQSIGGAPALHVEACRRVAGVALQSTISSLRSMARRRLPWLPLAPLLVRGEFDNEARVTGVRAPLLIVHCRLDPTVPFAESERLAAAQPRAEFLRLDGAEHADPTDCAGDDYLRLLGERFRTWTTLGADVTSRA